MTEAPLRLSARRHLIGELASRRMFAGHREELVDHASERTAATLEVLVALGALTDAEAEEWRARFERVDDPGPPDPEVRERALAYLDELGADDARRATATSAFAGIGLVSREETEGLWHPGHVLKTGFRSELDESVFLRAALGPPRNVGGVRVTVVELYEAAVVVDWHFRVSEDAGADARAVQQHFADEYDMTWTDEDDGEPRRLITLADDVGTRYEPVGSGWSGNDMPMTAATGHASFRPGVPRDAIRLDVLVLGTPLRVGLD
jgi:hypothetical protein